MFSSARYAEPRAKNQVAHPESLTGRAAGALYVSWLTTTAALCGQAATQARAAAAAYEAAPSDGFGLTRVN